MIWEIPLKIPAESGTFGEGFTLVNSKMRKTRCCDKTIIYLKIKLKKTLEDYSGFVVVK